MADKYVVIGFPQVQGLMEKKGFKKNSYLINDEQGINDFGCSAYFVNEEWYKKVTMSYEYVPESPWEIKRE